MDNQTNKQPGVNAFVGIVLVVLGCLWLAANFIPGFEIDWNFVWPLFILLPGMYLYSVYVRERLSASAWQLLIPANILTLLGLTFYVNTIFSELFRFPQIWGWTVFMYPASIGVSFLIAWSVSRKVSLLIPAVILGLLSIFVLCISMTVFTVADVNFRRLVSASWPIVLILFGLFMMFGGPLWKHLGKYDKPVATAPAKPVDDKPVAVEEAEVVQAPKADSQLGENS